MKNTLWLLIALSLTANAGEFAKKVKDVPEENIFWTQRKSAKKMAGVAAMVSGSEFEIKPKAIKKLIKAKKEHVSISVLLSGVKEKLLLVKQNPFTYETDSVHYAGIVKGDDDSLVSLSIFDGKLTGTISTKGRTYNLGTSGIVSQVTDVTDVPQPKISLDSDSPEFLGLQKIESESSPSQKQVKIYFEIGYSMYQAMGGNVVLVNQNFQSLFSQVAALYANIGVSVVAIQPKIWTTPDPYGTSNINLTLNNFGTAMLSNNYAADMAHLLVVVPNWGGVAYVNTLCSLNKGAKAGVSSIYSVISTDPIYSWPVGVVAHELGHSFGSKHTHWCGWVGGAIDGCSATEANNGVTCVRPPLPAKGKGTIMSYCHLQYNVGINFAEGFGPQPSAKIKQTIDNAACLGSVPNVDVTKPTVSITQPLAGDTVSGLVSIAANASDNVGVTRVDFFANGTLIGSDLVAPYSFSLSTISIPNGALAIKAIAKDAAGNFSESTVSVTVNNPAQSFGIASSVVGQDKTVADSTKRNWIDLTLTGVVGTPTFQGKALANTSWSTKAGADAVNRGNNVWRIFFWNANTEYDVAAMCNSCVPTGRAQVRFRTLP